MATERVHYSLLTTAESLLLIIYTVHGSGEVEVYQELRPRAGPDETYWDRQTGGKLGVYTGKVQEQMVPYIRPQECGNKMDVRRATITNAQGEGILLKGAPYFELEAHDHIHLLPTSDKTVVRDNHKQMGVGGYDSWGQRPEKEYMLYANRVYSHRFTLQGM
ncbi:hypothetical protein [Paenibacillus sp. sgz302251]|uniref:hypothetical protein n=1 Tax=Paenibacillus sp. sgz302251 TaxID=3414493 RepID=UPI003C7D9497